MSSKAEDNKPIVGRFVELAKGNFGVIDELLSPTSSITAWLPDKVRPVFSGTLVAYLVAGQPLDVLIAGDDEEAEETVARLVRDGGTAGHRRRTVGVCQAAGGPRVPWDDAPAAAGFELPERLKANRLGVLERLGRTRRRIDMSQHENLARTTTDPAASLPATLRLGAVHLTVSDLDRSVAFYEDALGLRLHRREDGVAAMGVGEEDLIVLYEEPRARRAGRHAGLYHYALLFPSREELAHAALRLAETKTPIQGASDHGTHEAIYLPDPDGNGIELAADCPREAWPDLANAGWDGGPTPLDMDGLLAAVAGEEPRREAGLGLAIGHVHLHVGDLDRGLAFYHDVLGFDVMMFFPGAAAFVSVGGYHHHLASNVWRGEGVPSAPPGRVGLRHWTVLLDDPGEVAAVRERVRAAGIGFEEAEGGSFVVRDPWGIPARFVARDVPDGVRKREVGTDPRGSGTT